MRLSNILRSVTLAFVGILLALLLVELPALFNLVDYRHVTWLSPDHFVDREFRVSHRPYAQNHGSALGGLASTLYQVPRSERLTYQWDAKYDAHGFRNNTDLDRADIVVVGASFVEGMTVPSALLMTTLVARQTGTVVANLGQINFAPQQDLLALKRYGLPLRPRTVIWMFTDFNDLRMVGFYMGATEAEPRGRWDAFFQRSFSNVAYQQLRPYFTYPKLRRELTVRTAHKTDGALRSGLVTDAQGKTTRIYFTHELPATDSYRLFFINKVRGAFADAYHLAAAQGARFVVVFLPESFRVFQPFARFPANSDCRRWIVNDEPQRIEAAVRSISPDIGYLDLTPVLRQAVSKGIIPYYTDDNHWSPAGHQIAARAIAEYLARALPSSPESARF